MGGTDPSERVRPYARPGLFSFHQEGGSVRNVTTVRVSDSERRLLRAAANREGLGWTTYLREKALSAAVDELTSQRDARNEDGEKADR